MKITRKKIISDFKTIKPYKFGFIFLCGFFMSADYSNNIGKQILLGLLGAIVFIIVLYSTFLITEAIIEKKKKKRLGI